MSADEVNGLAGTKEAEVGAAACSRRTSAETKRDMFVSGANARNKGGKGK